MPGRRRPPRPAPGRVCPGGALVVRTPAADQGLFAHLCCKARKNQPPSAWFKIQNKSMLKRCRHGLNSSRASRERSSFLSEIVPLLGTMNADETARCYRAFISYRHVDNREEHRRWAQWLHDALESYQVPRDLVRARQKRDPAFPEHLYPIFPE